MSALSPVALRAARISRSALILTATLSHFSISLSSLRADTGPRERTPALARHVALYLCRERLAMSYHELARVIGYDDHTSAVYGVKRIERALMFAANAPPDDQDSLDMVTAKAVKAIGEALDAADRTDSPSTVTTLLTKVSGLTRETGV